MKTKHLFRILGLTGLLALAGTLGHDARGDSVVQFMTAKSLPDATVSVIDPESGTSQGTSGSDVNIAIGDIILFRFSVASAPASAIDGIQSYITEYVPDGTELVGARMIDAQGNTVEPRRAGEALDGCAGGAECNSFTAVPSDLVTAGGTANFNTMAGHGKGSIAQANADTGIFFSTDARTKPTPANAFLTLDNGIAMNGMLEPRAINPEIVQLLNDTSAPYNAHNQWDWAQVRAYGGQGSTVVGGKGNGPFKYASPVAGPQTFYPFEATDTGTRVALNDVNGPWKRLSLYPGQQIGSGATNANNGITRMGTDTATGTDVTPAAPQPATAVRFALGDPRVGEVRFVEVALRVKSVPISSTFGTSGGNVDCGEVFGSGISSKSVNTGGSELAWPEYIGHPQCVFLRLKLDLTVDKLLAGSGDTETYTVFGKNLAVTNETNAHFRLKFVGSDQSFISATPPPNRAFSCPGESNKTCEEWDLGTLAPSDEFSISARLGVGGTGGGTNVVVGQYLSDQLDAIDPKGYQTTAMTVVQPASMPVIAIANTLDPTVSFAAAGSTTWAVNGTITNAGTTSWTSSNFTLNLPAGWSLTNNRIVVGGNNVTCTAGATPSCNRGDSYNSLQSRTLSFVLTVPAGAATGLYDLDIDATGSQSVFGSYETLFHKAVTVPVGQVRTAKPTLNCPVNSTAPSISGTSEASAAIRVLFDLIQRGTGTATAGGNWSVSNYGSFGELYGGLEVRATAQASGKLVSLPSDSCAVVTVKQCSDGIDNDGDGLIDFPADPGCTSLGDNSEADPVFPQCSDRLDNDADGFIDYPMDPQCTSAADNTENGATNQCNDGVDNDVDTTTDAADADCAAHGHETCNNTVDDDGDGLADAADPDCNTPIHREVTLRACQDGIDNDGDGKRDFDKDGNGVIDADADPGCDSPFDDDELDLSSVLDTKGRLLIAMDTSGSMNGITCAADTFTGGDGSTECPGTDQACATCANGSCANSQTDDARLFQVTDGMSNVVAAFGDVDYGLMRFHETKQGFSCPSSFYAQQSGGWQGGGIAPCTGGFNAGDVLVSFDPDNEEDILSWMDHDSDYNGVAPPGADWELRGSGTTPLAGILTSAKTYLDGVKAADTASSCRPYRVILVTDGNETCGGNPIAAATALRNAGFPVNVIGMATTDAPTIALLNNIASAGGTGSAFFANDQAGLSQAMAQIVQQSILVETCNGLDDDCDVAIDEDFPDLGDACDNGELGECFRPGTMVCSADHSSSVCNAPSVTPGVEVCNGLDDDCNGFIDDGLGGSCTCNPLPEICNGRDDNCNGIIDEGTLPGVGDACGPTTGECDPGSIVCANGALTCTGGQGPVTETCNGLDDDCDTFVDEVAVTCYDFPVGCDVTTGVCAGVCQTGIQTCSGNQLGACIGEVGPGTEACNGIDDDCDGTIDNGFPIGQACDNGGTGACFATGVLECNAAGGITCTAPDIQPGIETCNGLDDDCDGTIDEAADLGPPIGNSCGGGGACGIGTFRCQNSLGQTNQPDDTVVCVGSQTGTAESCNGFDDDCDSTIDEDVPGTGIVCEPTGTQSGLHYPPGTCSGGGICDDPISVCRLGATACQGGGIQCNGWIGPQTEIVCNGIDEDCDGADDQTCPNGLGCVDDACRNPCQPGEFPCPLGQYCDTTDGGFCLPDPCANIHCPPGFECDRDANPPGCVDLCDTINCPTGTDCVNGVCQDCFTLGCPTDQICVHDTTSGVGVCTTDLCADKNCPAGTFCDNGDCVSTTCDPACADNQVCIDAECHDGCPECTVGQICDYDTGRCVGDMCIDSQGDPVSCPPGEVCNPFDGNCEADPCVQLSCGAGTECVILPDGTASCFNPPPQPKVKITAGGGGCSTSGSSDGGALVLIGAALAFVRRRRRT